MLKKPLVLVLVAGAALFWPSCGKKEDNPGEKTAERYSCDGTPAQCLKIKSGWTFEGKITDEILVDPSAVKLPDGRFRIYANSSSSGATRTVISLISADGLNYTLESGTRIVADSDHDAFFPDVIVLPNGQFRMYLTDQRTHIGDQGAPAFISAISDNGLDFVWEPGERLRYSGTGDEAGGIRNPSVILLANGTYRMYYAGLPGTGARAAKVLSAVSTDGLTWSRESGVRWDPINLCPAATNSGVNPKVFLDHTGTCHMFNAAAACDDANHKNEAIGIFEATSQDGLTFSISNTAVVQGYYIKSLYHGNPTDPFENPEDPMTVLTPAGLRMYFNCGNTSASPPDARYYSIVNPTLN